MKNVILMLLCVASLAFAADVFEDFESYADTDALLAADWVYRPVAYNADTESPDGGKAPFILNTEDALGGDKCLESYVGNYDVNYRDWGFRANSGTWNWSSYNLFQFYYKGDVDIRVRIHNQYVPNIVYEKTFSRPETDQWVPLTVDLTNVTRTQVILVIFTVYDRTGNGTEVFFDDFVVGNDAFGSSVQPYYAGDPTEMQLSWFMDAGVGVEQAYLKWAPEGEPFVNEIMLTEPNNPFVGVMDVIPATNYKYQIEMNGIVKEGRFASETFASDTYIVENYETYADNDELRASSYTYGPASYGCVTTAYLENDSYDGANSVRFEFYKGYGTSVMAGLNLNGAYLMGYDKLRIWYKGDATNLTTGTNPREVKFRVQDSAGIFAEINAGKVVDKDYWDYVEFEIDNSATSRWDHVVYIVARIDRPAYEILNFSFDRIELINDLTPPQGDISGDLAVNWLDMDYVVSDWLSDTIEVAEQTVVSEDFESYATEPTNWSYYYNATAPSVISLLTSDAYEGNNALRWDYDVETSIGLVYSEILYTLGSAVDLSQYDKVRIRVRRYPTNSEENSLYLKFLDSGLVNDNLSGKTYIPGATVAATDSWFDWEIDLHSLNYADGEPDYTQLSDITNLQGIMLGVIGYQGAGRIDIDSIRFVKDAQCSVLLTGDINGDCVVNIRDYAVIAQDWLTDLLAE